MRSRIILLSLFAVAVAAELMAGTPAGTGKNSADLRKGGGSIFSVVSPIRNFDKTGPLVTLFSHTLFEKDGKIFTSGSSEVSIYAVDIATGNHKAAGVATTYFLLDEPEPSGCIKGPYNSYSKPGTCTNPVFSGPVILPGGVHSLYFFAVDKAGNTGKARTETLLVDGVPPEVALTINGVKLRAGGTRQVGARDTIEIDATDPVSHGVASGLKAAYFLVDITREECENSGDSYEGNKTGCENYIYRGAFNLSEGKHVVYFTAEDNVGNSGPMRAVYISVAPGRPGSASKPAKALSDSDREALIKKHYLSAEKMLAEKFPFKAVAAEYRKAVSLAMDTPEWMHEVDGEFGGEPSFGYLAKEMAERLEAFIVWTRTDSGEPSNIETVKNWDREYLSSQDFLRFIVLRPQWVLANKDRILEHANIPWNRLQGALEKKWQYSMANPVYCANVNTNPGSAYEMGEFNPPDEWVRERLDCFYSREKQLKSNKSAWSCLSELTNIKPREDVLKVFIKAREGESRDAAYTGIAKFNPKNVLELLTPGLKDKNMDIRYSVFNSIRRLENERSVGPFLTLLDTGLKENAYCDILKFKDKALPYLEKSYQDAKTLSTWDSISDRANILSVAAEIKTQASFDFVEKQLRDPEEQLRSCAATALFHINPSRAAPILKKILKSHDHLDEVAKVNAAILIEAAVYEQ